MSSILFAMAKKGLQNTLAVGTLFLRSQGIGLTVLGNNVV